MYLERLLERTGTLMNKYNWKRLFLTSIIIASKLWDDESLENQHFSKIIGDISTKELNSLERVFFDLVGYDLSIKGPEYAKHYFTLRTIAQYNGILAPYSQISVDQVRKFQESNLYYESDLSRFCKDVNDFENSI